MHLLLGFFGAITASNAALQSDIEFADWRGPFPDIEPLTKAGFVWFTVNYRLLPKVYLSGGGRRCCAGDQVCRSSRQTIQGGPESDSHLREIAARPYPAGYQGAHP